MGPMVANSANPAVSRAMPKMSSRLAPKRMVIRETSTEQATIARVIGRKITPACSGE